MPLIADNKQTLDVIIATYNRSALLSKTLKSLLAAKRPEGLSISVVVVDNNSTDNTRAVVEEFAGGETPFPITYLFEATQGKSHALNSGLRFANADLIGMVDDDEEIDGAWFEVIQDVFHRTQADFIGGPYHPNWSGAKPDWVTLDVGGVVGWADWGKEERPFELDAQFILLGGNAVVKRSVFETVGVYDVTLGRTSHGLLSCEDYDMYRRIMTAGFRGLYIPSLIIHHFVAPERLKKDYHRRWNYGNGISHGVMARREASGAAELLGIPRWRLRRCAAALPRCLSSYVGLANKIRSFHEELQVWNLFGFIYGRHFCNVEAVGAASIPAQKFPSTHVESEEQQWLRA